MKITWKTFLAVSAYWAGVFGWFYIGVWQVLKKPVHSVILAQIAGHLSIGLLHQIPPARDFCICHWQVVSGASVI